MSTVLVNHYIYKGNEYTDLDELLGVLINDGVQVTKGQIPGNVGWQRSFWQNHDVDWYQSEKEQDVKKITAARIQALNTIKTMYTKVQLKGIKSNEQYRISYATLCELNVFYHGIQGESGSSQYQITDQLKLTHDQILELINQISKKYAVVIEQRNIAIKSIKQAQTITEVETATNKFIEYCELLIE